MTSSAIDPLIGRTLSDFVISAKLGEGGFGAVYKAKQLVLGREVVVKVLHAKHRTNPEVIERFKREAHLASKLEHPYCAHIYSFGVEADGLLWIAMEFVQGTSLSEILKIQKNLPLERFVPLLDKICEVVYTAHEFGIVHRDLKPANIMVISRAGRMLPKLLDFGIAKGLKDRSETNEKTGNVQENSKNPIGFSLPNISETIVVKGQDDETIISDIKEIFDGNTVVAEVKNRFFELKNVFQSGNASGDQGQTLMFDAKSTAISDDQESGSIFKTQGIMGSPAYMSPEQWQMVEKIDSRSDIYSLGVLTYQAITGELPFKGEGLELYGAHLDKPVPPLKEGFPTSLNKVMEKVMAKRPEDRYQNALEFAKEFRQSANFTEQNVNLPTFDEILKENILTNAPKPLADTVVNLVAASNTYQFKDRILIVFRVLVRYIGILALASYAHITKNQSKEELINQKVATLYQYGLTETQWLEFSKELCRPFAKKCDAFPIPELISLFFSLDSEEETFLTEIFTKLLHTQQEIYSSASLTEDHLLFLLNGFLTKLTTLLKSTSWLNDYYLVLPDGDKVSKCMGIAKDLSFVKVKAKDLLGELDKKTALVDSSGCFVLSLWPLIEITEPSPNAPLEVFLLESKGRSREKTKLISLPHGFQIETLSPWEWIKENFLPEEEKKQTDLLPELSPYLGLTTFSPTDSAFFFGREKETEGFLNRLRIQPLLAVVGPSGAGKSSFVQAGVIPSLDEQWRVITVRPGATPLLNLSGKLIKEGVKIPKIDINSKTKNDILRTALSDFSDAKKVSVLLVIDQFEELFTLCLDQQERELYARYLANAAMSENDPVRIIITLRDDFLIRVKSLPSLRDIIAHNLELLATPQPEDLLRILTQPAKCFGYEFEDEKLTKEIVKSVEKEASALPLLAFTAAKLWELRDRQLKRLLRKAYVDMGGIGGSLTQHAEKVMEEMSQEEQKLLREAFRHLVTSEGTRTVITRSDLKQLLGNNREADLVIEKLVTARLLVASESDDGTNVTIEVIHEALLSAWPRLVKWRQEVAESARLRDQLRVAAKQWQDRNRPKGLLWRDEALAEYQLWKLHYKGNLTDVETEFTQASLSEANRNQRIRNTLVISAMVVLLIGSGIMFYQRQQTQKQLSETLELYEEQGRQEIIKNNLDGAAVYLSEAYAKGANSLALKYMLSIALSKSENRPPVTLNTHTNSITMAVFSPDDKLVATTSTDKTAKIWQTSTGRELFSLEGHKDILTAAEFSPDGALLVTSSLDKTAKVWRVSDGTLLRTFIDHTDGLRTAQFSPDGRQILTTSYDSTAKIWDVLTGNLRDTLASHQSGIYAVSYSKDSKLIVTGSSDKTAKVWDSNTGELKATLSDHQASVTSVAFSPDSKLLVTGSNDGKARVWQIDGKLIYTLSQHKEGITTSKFSFDGKSILTTSRDKTASVWNSETGNLVNILVGHQKDISMGGFSPDDKLVITVAYDNTARIWERATGKFLVTLSAHEKSLISGFFSFSGNKVLTASLDKTAKIWDVMVETRLPKEISLIVEEKVPIFLKEGRLIAKYQKINSDNNQASTEILIPATNKTNENMLVETLDNGVKIEMIKVEGGVFDMGSPIDEKGRGGNEEVHKVTVSSFYIGKYEVTQAQWREIASQPLIKTSLLSRPATFQGDNLPVDNVSWEEAVEFCARLSKLTGKNYRLPTEAEWEFAARAGNKESYSGNLEDVAWYDKNSTEKTHTVGQKLPNAFGLYDMHGNLWEWCNDFYADYQINSTNSVNPTGVNAGTGRVRRGGSWFSSAADCRSAKRNTSMPDYHGNILGFRLLMTVD
jgi:formylglycine-generating enzyme required for sulfatase activity/WD40 repeat protein/serine/threonine protein kinase